MPRPRNVVAPPACHVYSHPAQPLYYPADKVRSPFELDMSIHTAVTSVRRELLYVFPDLAAHLDALGSSEAARAAEILVIVTFQPSREDLLAWTPRAASEKDRLLENFFAFSSSLRTRLLARAPGSYTDYVDPCSGQPTLGRHSAGVYSEVEGAQRLMGYSIDQVAQCVVVKHPRWGAAAYPATLVTTASAEDVAAVVAEMRAPEGTTVNFDDDGDDDGAAAMAAAAEAEAAEIARAEQEGGTGHGVAAGRRWGGCGC